MNLLHLEYFYIVAREQGFTRASEKLRIQQPAISRMVKLLEEDLGFKLFERYGRGVRVTRQGEEVFAHCVKIFGEVEALKVDLGRVEGECRGPLAFAASEPIATGLVPKILADYLKLYPMVYPQMFSGPARQLIDNIYRGDLEFGLFFHIPDLPQSVEVVIQLPLRFHLVVRRDLRQDSKVIQSFIGSREIDDTTTRRFPTIERMRRDYPQVKIKISSNNLSAHREMVATGLGVSILPEFLVRDDLARRHFIDLYPRERFEFKLKVVKRKTAQLSLNTQRFLEYLSRS